MADEILNNAQLGEHIEHDLSDNALQRLNDADTAEILRRFEALDTVTELLPGGEKMLILKQKLGSDGITSVTETVGTTDTVLAADDYRLWYGGAMLERLEDGTNPRSRWGDRVSVVYVPEDRLAQRRLVLIQLVKLAFEYRGLKSEAVGAGDHSMTALDYTTERENILRSLVPRGFVCA